MLWLKAFHIFFMVTWFSGLFYLPRLYVYHAMSDDQTSLERFKIMERKLLFGIMTPGGILTTFSGLALLFSNSTAYLSQGWMHAKLLLVVVLWIYHGICWKYYIDFKNNQNKHTHVFYRYFNEFPVLVLLGTLVLVVVKPL